MSYRGWSRRLRKAETLYGLTAETRANLYLFAAYTGLRASELANATADGDTITVPAGYSKHRRDDTLPLHRSLIGRPCEFRGQWAAQRHGSRMLRADLARAGIPYRTNWGVADFHSLRHTFITSLARSGVHPSKAQAYADCRKADGSATRLGNVAIAP